MADLTKTQHFTKQYSYILQGIDCYPAEAIDPFAGDCDLQNYSPNSKWTFYDIDPKNNSVIKNDSLLSPIDYSGKWVITNPPYLAKNKTNEFQDIFEKYGVDDLYKASLLSIIDCEGGVLIIPINFFTDEASKDIRIKFLSKFKISRVNVFESQVFEDTSYNVCSFSFEKGVTQDVEFFNIDKGTSFKTVLKQEFGFRLGGDFYNLFTNEKKLFSRLTADKTKFFTTNIFVECLDKRHEKIHAEYNTNHFVGKKTDRIFMTLTCKQKLSEQQERDLIKKFNNFLTSERAKYDNLILTNYRDFGRKRISMDDVYKIFTHFL